MEIDPKKYWPLGDRLARKVGSKASTLRSAVDRGELETLKLGDGTTIIAIADVKAWVRAADQRRTGPKAKD